MCVTGGGISRYCVCEIFSRYRSRSRSFVCLLFWSLLHLRTTRSPYSQQQRRLTRHSSYSHHWCDHSGSLYPSLSISQPLSLSLSLSLSLNQSTMSAPMNPTPAYGSAPEKRPENAEEIGWAQLKWSRFLALGSFISLTCDLVLFPFDLIKTRFQVAGTVSLA